MQPISRTDRLFTGIYAGLIIIIGVFVFMGIQSGWVILFTLGTLLFYLFLALRKPYRRYRAIQEDFPREWRCMLEQESVFYRCLDVSGRKRFEEDTAMFLSEFSIRGRRRAEISPDIRLAIAATVATMIHGRPEWEPPVPDGVVVYPGQVFNRKFISHRGNYAGMATPNAPLLLTEGSLDFSRRNPHDGYNVIIHELAHYFDAQFTGTELKKLIHRQWEQEAIKNNFLDDYALTNEQEFFAVAVESFFERPWTIRDRNAELYNALKEFFNLDAAALIPQPVGESA